MQRTEIRKCHCQWLQWDLYIFRFDVKSFRSIDVISSMWSFSNCHKFCSFRHCVFDFMWEHSFSFCRCATKLYCRALLLLVKSVFSHLSIYALSNVLLLAASVKVPNQKIKSKCERRTKKTKLKEANRLKASERERESNMTEKETEIEWAKRNVWVDKWMTWMTIFWIVLANKWMRMESSIMHTVYLLSNSYESRMMLCKRDI